MDITGPDGAVTHGADQDWFPDLWQQRAGCGPTAAAVILSCLADKDISDMLPFIRRIAGDAPLFVPTIQDNERAMNGEELAKLLAEGRGPAITQPTQRLSLALKETASFVPAEDADRHPVLLCGSLYLLGEFFNLHPQTLEQELV